MTSALVIGAGIAGPVAAMALQQAGIDVCVYEKRPLEEHEAGTWLTIASNGMDALAAINAHQIATHAGFPTPSNRLISSLGSPLRTFAIGGPLADGTESHTVKRARLARGLGDEARRRGIEFHYGCALAEVRVTENGRATATFADGTVATADVLIGCDGIRSVVRQAIDPVAPPPRYVDMVNYGGYVPAEESGDLDCGETGVWHMSYGGLAFFGHVADPTGGIVWFANVPGPEVSREERASTDPATWRLMLADLYADDPGPASALVMRGSLEVAGDNVFDHPSTPLWHDRSLVVIGDAAHAPSSISGQGAGIAMEDAVILAQCLRDVHPAHRALAHYESLRRGRVERMVDQASHGLTNKIPGKIAYGSLPLISSLAKRSAAMKRFDAVLRDRLLRLVYRRFITQDTIQWGYDHHIDWDQPVVDIASLPSAA